MKKILLTLGLAFTMAPAWAAKAWNQPITVTQPDGTTITVYLHGDEDFSWYTSVDGKILIRNGNTFTPITETKEEFFAKAAEIRKANAKRREPVTGNTRYLFPHTGSPKALVILAEYPDKKFSLADPKLSFDQYLNKADGEQVDFGAYEHRNAGSVRQYFSDMSNGTFTPQFDVVGPVTLPQNMEYYGGTNSTGSDERVSQMIVDACELVKDDVDFSEYDSNNDGYIDLVYVIYAGYGQSMGAANNTVWPKATYVTTGQEYNGKKLYRAGVNNELLANENAFNGEKRITGLGLFIHEFSHCLGLPDFYATRNTSTAYDNQGMEDWSVMDNGLYKYNGWIPTAYTAWEREAMGWLSIDELNTPEQLKMETIDRGGKAYRIKNDANADDYLVIERIQNRYWNARLGDPSKKLDGLLVYHVDYNSGDFSISSNNVNNIVGHPKMAIVPADGLLVSSYKISDAEEPAEGKYTTAQYRTQLMGDIYGDATQSGVATFTQSAETPNSAWWTEGTNVSIYNICLTDDGEMHIDFGKNFATDGISAITSAKAQNSIYNINGTRMSTGIQQLPKGIYIVNGKKIVK